MKTTGGIALMVIAAGLALATGFWLNSASNRGNTHDSGNVAQLMAASFPDMESNSQALAQWRGKVLIVNFWATWCEPCLKEIPEFIRMQQKFGDQGLQIVGIAVDNAANVREFAAKYRMNYPVLIGELDAIELAKVAGNKHGGLPFTVVVDRTGQLIATELGGLDEQKLMAIIEPAM